MHMLCIIYSFSIAQGYSHYSLNLITSHNLSYNLNVVKTYDLTFKTFHFVWGFLSKKKKKENQRQYSQKYVFCFDTPTQIINITNMWLLMITESTFYYAGQLSRLNISCSNGCFVCFPLFTLIFTRDILMLNLFMTLNFNERKHLNVYYGYLKLYLCLEFREYNSYSYDISSSYINKKIVS